MSKTKYAQPQGLELLTQVVEDVGPIFNIDQARAVAPALGILQRRIPGLLSRLAASGWIIRLKRGTYVAQSPLFSATIHPFAIAQALVEPLTISHWSALAHRPLSTVARRWVNLWVSTRSTFLAASESKAKIRRFGRGQT